MQPNDLAVLKATKEKLLGLIEAALPEVPDKVRRDAGRAGLWGGAITGAATGAQVGTHIGLATGGVGIAATAPAGALLGAVGGLLGYLIGGEVDRDKGKQAGRIEQLFGNASLHFGTAQDSIPRGFGDSTD